MLFSDESKFKIFQEKRRKFVRRLANERMIDQCIIQTVKHSGGSVMVWGCFVGDKVDDFVRIEATAKKEDYHDILQRHGIPSGKQLIGHGFIIYILHTKNYLSLLD